MVQEARGLCRERVSPLYIRSAVILVGLFVVDLMRYFFGALFVIPFFLVAAQNQDGE